MLKTFSFFLLALLIICPLKGAETDGTPYLTNFIYPERSHNFIWSITQSPRNTILIAKRTGLIEYNSEDWTSINTPDIPLKIKTSVNNELVYISGRSFAGFLSLDNSGNYIYHSLDSTNTNNLYTDIIETSNEVYFYSTERLLEYNKQDETLKHHSYADTNNVLTGMFALKNTLYLSLQNKGITTIRDTNNIFYETPEPLLNSQISFHCPFDSNRVLVGTTAGGLFLFNGVKFQEFNTDTIESLSTSILTDGVVVNDKILALSTKNHGVILIRKDNGETLSVVNQNSGLPSNHVNTVMVDNMNGLWIAHTKGLSRIDTKIPVINYNSFAGLDANVNAIYYWDNILYLATSNGVYSLDTINEYDTKEMVERIPVKTTYTPVYHSKSVRLDENLQQSATKAKISTNNIDTDSTDTEKKGFLKKLFSKRKPDNEGEIVTKPIVEEKTTAKTKPKRVRRQVYQTFKYETFVLKSKSYGYSNFKNITEQCNYFIPFKNELLAICDVGIYAIKKNKEVNKIFTSTNIFHVSPSTNTSDLLYVISSEGIYFGQLIEGEWQFILQNRSNNNFTITSLIELSETTFLLALNNQLVYYSITDEKLETIKIDNPYSERIYLKNAGKKNYVIVGNDLYQIFGDEIEVISLVKEKNVQVIVPYLNQQNNFWIKGKYKKFHFFGKDSLSANALAFLSVFNNITDIHIDSNKNIWIVDDNDLIYKINSFEFDKYEINSELSFESIQTIKGNRLPFEKINLTYGENGLIIKVFSPTYLHSNTNQYQYIITGLTNKWSVWSNDNIINVPYIPSGKFTLKVRCRDILGNISETKSIEIKVMPPFWETYYFYIAVILFIAILIFVLQRLRLRKLLKEKQLLSDKVKERTHEIEQKNKAITDSINYAGKMQSGLLPSQDLIRTYLSNFFIYYQPKDIVSGDFYYATQKNQYTVLAAADCTGHGVPGAFMSMLGMAYMNEIVGKTTITSAAQILETLRNKIIQLLSQRNAESRDGMDIALLVFDNSKNTLQYSGAHNPLYRIVSKNNELSDEDMKHVSKETETHYLVHYKANRFHVGKSNYTQVKFTNHKITYNSDDVFYIFSDGFADQFGGPEERKFMYGPFKKLILDIAEKPMDEQKEILSSTIDNWMNGYDQTDDMLIFGIRPK